MSSEQQKAMWVLVAILVVGTAIRFLPAMNVVTDNGVWFIGADSWYHMRLADYSAVHLLSPLTVDPLQGPVGYRPMLAFLIAALSRFTPLSVDMAGAVIPVLVGLLAMVAVYLLARRMFPGRPFVALVAVAFMAFLPTQFLARTLFGYADHHGLEVLFTAVTLWALLRLRVGYWWLVAGVSLGLLMLAWQGATLFWAILGFYYGGLAMWRYITRHPSPAHSLNRVWMVMTVAMTTFALVGAAVWGMNWSSVQTAVIQAGVVWAGICGLVILPAWRSLTVRWLTALLLLVGVVAVWANMPSLRDYVALNLRNTFVGAGTNIIETASITPATVVSFHWWAWPLLIAGFWLARRERARWLLVVIWTAVMGLATLGQIRWSYYLAVPVSIFGGVVVVWLAGRLRAPDRLATRVGLVAAVIVLTLSPMLVGTLWLAGPKLTVPEYEAMAWLRDNTPYPFARDLYLENGMEELDYRVLSWWDYGHYLLRLGRRPAVASPSHQFDRLQDFFSDTDAHRLDGTNVRYVLVTEDMVGEIASEVMRGFPPSGLQVGAVRTAVEESMTYRLWMGQADGFRPVYRTTMVGIWERDDVVVDQ